MPALKVRIGCVVLAVIMSAVTYYFVEPRLRWGRFGGYKAAGLLSVMVAVGVAGYSIEKHDGYTARMNDPDQTVIDAINKKMKEDNLRCLKVIPDWNRLSDTWDITKCMLQRPAGNNTIAVIGDSHAGHLYPGLTLHTMENEGIALFPSGCSIPLIGLHSGADPNTVNISPYRANTEHLMSEGFNYILSHKNITKVVLSHRPGCSWNNVVDTRSPSEHDFNSILRNGFVRTYDALTKAGKEIYVVLDNPFYSNDVWQKCKASVLKRPVAIPVLFTSKSQKSCENKRSELVERQMVDTWNKIAHETAMEHNVHFIDLESFFCRDGFCSMLDSNGNMLYMDFTHLNFKGSASVAPFILGILRKK